VPEIPEQESTLAAASGLGDELVFEELLAELSASFVGLRADQIDAKIEDAQRRICECLGIDHSTLWQASHTEPEILLLTHLFRDPRLPPAPDRMDGDAYFPWAQQKIKRKEILCVPNTADVPPEAAIDKQTWQRFGIKSALVFPLWVGDGPAFGVLAFDATTHSREWPEALVKRLRLLAQVFANALARERTEWALLEREARLRLAAAAANAGLWTLDPVSGRIWATDETKALFGLGPTEEFDLKRFLRFVHPEHLRAVNNIIEQAIQSGEDKSLEYQVIRTDGETRWIYSRGRRSSKVSNEPQLIMGISLDVTQQKQLEDTRSRHSAIVESSNDAIISMNLQGVILDWNAAAEMIYGYAAEEVVGKDIDLVIPPEFRDEQARMLTLIGTGEHINLHETIRVRKDGKTVSISQTLSPIRNSTGKIVGAAKIARDISDARRHQEILHKSYEEIRQLKEKLQAESNYLQEEIKDIGKYEEIVGQSKSLREVLRKVEQVAPTDSIVLITGESGTGKELIARAIHGRSKRKDRAIVKVDCASLPSSLIESELFGREKGAYTGALTRQIGRIETADGSTLFLDEIGELGVEVQAKLLRIVQDGEFERLGSAKTSHVNVRIVAATHRDLAERVKNGTFREDLFYRLNVFPISVPPLRERIEDIPLLVMAFVREFEEKMGKKVRSVPNRVMHELTLYPWPGNIRELRNVVERAVIITTGERLNLQLPKTSNLANARTLKEAETQHILSALEKSHWRIKGPEGAAKSLGMNPSTLYTKMRHLRIPTRHEKGVMQS
jgi:formate hydrogenlyase transcriptional activator